MYSRSFLVLLLALSTRGRADLLSEDGVLVEEMGEVRTVAGQWTILIVIHPLARPETERWIQTLEAGISKAGAHLTASDRELWLHRMAALQPAREVPMDDVPENAHHDPMASPTDHGRRVRRGLFDFVGKLSQTLFGTATQEDLLVLQEAVKQTQAGMAVLHHNAKEMLSVLNQTRRYVRENRMDLRTVQRETIKLAALATATARRTATLEVHLGRLRIQRQVDLALQQMEMAIWDYHLQEHVFHRQKTQMEWGWLTEDILPPASLRSILRQLHSRGYHTVPLEWYYENIRVSPLWDRSRELAFQTVIPALSPKGYLHYGLTYFEMPMGADHLRRIVGRPELAIDTESGASFVPDQCIGHRPKTCWPVSEYTQRSCEGHLVSGTVAANCHVTVSPKGNRTVGVFPTGSPNVVIVSAYVPTGVALRCRGRAARRWTVSGPEVVSVPGDCVLETGEWRVSGLEEGQSMVHLLPPKYISVPGLNFTWPKLVTRKIQERLSFADRVE